MSFPASPTNGQQTAIGGVLYEYNSSTNVWKRIPVVYSLNANNTTFSNVTISSNVIAGNFLYANGVSVTSDVQAGLTAANVAWQANAAAQQVTINNITTIHPFLLAGM